MSGWCAECVVVGGQYVLAADPSGSRCAFHARFADQTTRRPARQPTWPPGSAPPPGAAAPARSRPGPSGPGRGREGRRARRALARAVGRARGRAYGRERARRRLASGRWDPHPGWRNRVDDDLVVLTDQVAALARVEQLVDTELWRADKQDRWTRMLHRLVHSMDWTTGLVCGVTAAQLATAGGCAPRTVSRLLAWAQDVDLVVVVEAGASGAFLGTDRNRAPAYVFVAPPAPLSVEPVTPDDQPGNQAVADPPAQLSTPVDENGDLSLSYAGNNPLTGGRRLSRPHQPQTNWSLWQIPTTPGQRSAAVTTLLGRIGLDNHAVPVWRARALLHPWWTAGACVAGLLHAIDHHPDRPDQPRGNALRGAADPLRVLGYRLRPWVGQLHQLPPELTGHHGDYRAKQATQVADRIAAAERDRAHHTDQPSQSRSTTGAREAARAALAATLAEKARRRETAGGHRASSAG
ncbi:MAG: hypothetical protein ACRDRQ_23825 [Pseudonocardiaceae bacterium]